jgi:hypothetical protein
LDSIVGCPRIPLGFRAISSFYLVEHCVLPSSDRCFVSFLISLFGSGVSLRQATVLSCFDLDVGLFFCLRRTVVLSCRYVFASIPLSLSLSLCHQATLCPTHPPYRKPNENPHRKPPVNPNDNLKRRGEGRESGGGGGPMARGRAWGSEEDR